MKLEIPQKHQEGMENSNSPDNRKWNQKMSIDLPLGKMICDLGVFRWKINIDKWDIYYFGSSSW
jgi:hypothetical protein